MNPPLGRPVHGGALTGADPTRATARPMYVAHMPPCTGACRAGADVQGWLYHAESGDHEAAWRHLTRDNPFPAITGRTCHHPCEAACNRGKLDGAVGIAAVERFLGDEALARGWRFDAAGNDSGKHVLVVGAGPSGLSAAYHLRRLGHRVSVKEAGPAMGGMMRGGIPESRLPRDVADGEIQRVLAMGVSVRLHCKVERIADELEPGRFDAAYLAAGAQNAGNGFLQVDPVTHMAAHPGLFAGGDMSERSVAVAVGRGRVAARQIDCWLRGVRYEPAAPLALASFERLNPWYYSDAPRSQRSQPGVAGRAGDLDEAQRGFSEENALAEARRCLSCGSCFECGTCHAVCTENAIVKLGPGNGFRFELDECNGCGACVAECPCGAIEMV